MQFYFYLSKWSLGDIPSMSPYTPTPIKCRPRKKWKKFSRSAWNHIKKFTVISQFVTDRLCKLLDIHLKFGILESRASRNENLSFFSCEGIVIGKYYTNSHCPVSYPFSRGLGWRRHVPLIILPQDLSLAFPSKLMGFNSNF